MAGILNAQNNIAASFPALDQYGPNTTLLLHGDGTNGAQNNTFLDSSANNFTITRNGNTTQGTFSPFSQPDGYWSNYFNNSGYLYNGSATSVANFGTGNYTIEAWFYYVASTGTYQFIFDASTPGSSSVNIRLLMNSSNQIQIYNPSSPVYTSGTTIVSNTWYHIAVCRGGTGSNQSALFINGARDGTFTDSSNYAGGVCCVGACSNNPLGINPLYGYISNLRVVKGTDVYGYSNPSITVPTSPLTAVTNTTLLTCQSNRFVDNSASPVTLTVTGTPAVQSFHPISAPTSYFPAVNGGGAYFDGSGDYLNAGSNAAFAFGTGAYTVEMWVYPFSISQQIYMINDTTGGSGFYFETNSSAGFSILPRGGGSGLTGGYSSLIINSWNHIVFCRASTSSNQTSIFVNGARVANGTDSNNWTVTGPCSIGGFSPGSYMLNGYMSQVRLVKGTDVYGYSNNTITVPTAPLTAIANTSLLLSCTNAGIIDSVSQNQLETVGNAQVSTTQSKFGAASMYFDGSTSYASLLNNPVNVLGDFTIEGWFYSASATSSFMGLFGFGAISSSISPVTLILGNATSGANPASSVTLLASVDGSNWAILSASASGTTANNTWIHFAVVRSGGKFTVYLNGNAVITSTAIAATTSLYAGGTINRVGAYGYSGYYYSGYIDDFRVTKGVARYTQNFTPPQNAYPNYGPLTNIPTVDPNFNNTTLLLHGNGTNGAQNNTFLDSSTNNFTITRNGNTTQGTFTPFSQPNGWWSNYQSDASSNYINFTTSTGTLFQFPADFTIECWIYPTSITGDGSLWIESDGTNSYMGININTTGYSLYLNGPAGGGAIGISAIIPLNQWSHVAMVRSGSTVTVYTNGLANGTTSNSSTVGYSSPSLARTGGGASNAFYMSNLRIVKGTAVYTSNFTPSIQPLTNITNTSLLTCQSGRFVDNSSNALVATVTGTPTVQSFYPFFPPLDYSTAAIGGSGYFDGGGDYLGVPNSTSLDIGSSSFTLECWIYQTAASGTYTVFGRGGGAANWSTSNGMQYLLDMNTTNIYWETNNSGNDSFITTSLPSLNQWNHVVVGYNGTTTRMWINGSSVGTISTSYTVPTTTNITYVGNNPAASQFFPGYISNLRFVKGTDVYGVGNTTITVPTAPLTAITNTSLLLSATNGGIFDNASKNTFETVSNAQISTTQSKFGGSSMYFNGSSYIIASPSQPSAFLTSNFTVEYWIYFNSTSANRGTLIVGSGSSGYDALFGWMNASGGPFTLYLSSNNSSWDIANNLTIIPATISTGQWYHVAITRNGSTFKTFCNGNQVSTATSSASIYQTDNRVVIGKYQGGAAYYIDAYINDVRITNGVSRYNTNFTPPAAPFPNK